MVKLLYFTYSATPTITEHEELWLLLPWQPRTPDYGGRGSVSSGINWQVKRLSCTTGRRFIFPLIIRHCLSRLRSASSCRLSWGFHSVLLTAEDSETKQSPFWPHKPSKKKKKHVNTTFLFAPLRVENLQLCPPPDYLRTDFQTREEEEERAETSQLCFLSSFTSGAHLIFPPSQTGA